MKLSGYSLLLLLFCGVAQAQVASHTVNLIISPSVQLKSISGNDATTLNFVSAEDVIGGITQTEAGSYEVRANTNWVVTAKASSAFFKTSVSGDDSEIPSSILYIKANKGEEAEFLPLSMDGIALQSGGKPSKDRDNTFSVDYMAQPGIDASPGIYSIDVLLTVTGN